jgi:AraC family transcriptional regulator
MQQPGPYLFPEGSEFGRDNLVLHATGRRHLVKDFHGPLSIKSVMRGEVLWIVEGRSLAVDSSAFLVLNEGQPYSMEIDAPRPLETCCAFFRNGFVESVAQDAVSSLESSLDEPFRAAPRVQFLSRLHTDGTRSILPHLWSLAERCAQQLQPISFEEDFLILSKSLLSLYREITEQVARVPAARASTREELFRRLQVAREYLHGSLNRRISLEEVAREACVSRYHLHRAFRRVFRQTPHAYVTSLRLSRAYSYLEAGRPVTDVAMDVGFSSLSSFTRLFRSRYAVPPSSVPKIRKIGQAAR